MPAMTPATPAAQQFDPFLLIPPALRNTSLISTSQFIEILNTSRPVFFEMMAAGQLPTPARNTGRSNAHHWHIASVAEYLASLKPEASTVEERQSARRAAIEKTTPHTLKAVEGRLKALAAAKAKVIKPAQS